MKTRVIPSLRRLTLLSIAAIATPALAHEFWLEPSSYQPAAGERVEISVIVGEHFEGRSIERSPDRIERFTAMHDGRDTNISGNAGDEPAGAFSPATSGLHTVVYDSNHAHIELSGAKFTSYLKEKGLDAILDQRAADGETSATAIEIYSRCVKTLLSVGMSENETDRPVGMPLEIVAGFNPYASNDSTEASFQILYLGKPAEGIRLTAQSKQDDAIQSQRSDENGNVVFQLDNAGPWLVEGTHMRETPELDDVDYESVWASLTFELAR